MSSATAASPGAGTTVLAATAPGLGGTNARIANLGMSPRQQALNLLWARFCCEHYASRRWDWNGREVLDPLAREAVASGNTIPPGFYDAGGQMAPLSIRKPTAPYNLGRVVVNRFTGMLFSSSHHPQLRVPGDPDTEDFTRALADASRVWAHMIEARNFGGAEGSVAVGFQFVDGLPRVEVHDPRWCTPKFSDRDRLELSRIEKRYMYPEDRLNPDTNEWETAWFWYRRVIDEQSDTVWAPVPVADGEEPAWDALPAKGVPHGFGFCPVVWIQNTPVQDDIDGEPDCAGIFDTLDAIDALLAQANLGTLANSDPTLLIISDKPMGEIRKGSDNAIKLAPSATGGAPDARYIELQGSGPKAARELAIEFRAQALEVVQCVLDQPVGQSAATATEIIHRYSAMMERCDVFREQYGERGVKRLLEMMVRAARLLLQPRPKPAGEGDGLEVQVLRLPPRVVSDPNDPTKINRAARKLGEGGTLELQWPPYFTPTAEEAQAWTLAAVAAKAGGLVDVEHAAQKLAPVYGVEDVPAMLRKISGEAAEQQAAIERLAMQGVTGMALGQVVKGGVVRMPGGPPNQQGEGEQGGDGQQPDQAPPPVHKPPPDEGDDGQGGG